GLLDAGLPEANAFGQPFSVARAGQEAREEVGVGRVERPQAARDDPDGRARRGRYVRRAPWKLDVADRGLRSDGQALRARNLRSGNWNARGGEKMLQVVGQVVGRAIALRGPAGQGLETNAL